MDHPFYSKKPFDKQKKDITFSRTIYFDHLGRPPLLRTMSNFIEDKRLNASILTTYFMAIRKPVRPGVENGQSAEVTEI